MSSRRVSSGMLFLLAVLLASSLLAQQGGLSEDADEIVQQAEDARRERVREAESRLKAIPETLRALRDGKISIADKSRAGYRKFVAGLKQERKRLEAELEQLKRNDPPYVPILLASVMKPGEFGRFPEQDARFYFEVEQVLGEKEMLVVPVTEFRRRDRRTGLETGPFIRDPGESFWLRGVETGELADGRRVALNGTYRVTGNRTFRTVAGANRTVVVVEPFSIEPYRALLIEAAQTEQPSATRNRRHAGE